jgi:hypothetical protein
MPFHHVAVELNESQARNAMRGKGIRIMSDQLKKGHLVLHPLNKKKLEKALLKGKTAILELSPAELAETALYHIQKHGMEGSGFWGKIWNGLKKGWKFLKDSGIATKAFDALVPMATGAVGTLVGQPELGAIAGTPVREGIRKLTGAGVEEEADRLIKKATGKRGRMTKKDREDKLKGMGLYLS